MAVADGRGLLVFKDMGLVSQVLDEATLATLHGHLAIGHTRYSTTGGSRWEDAQPAFKTNAAGGDPGCGWSWSTPRSCVATPPRRSWPCSGRSAPARNYPIPIPHAAGLDLRPSAATQPSTLPLPNP
jgi:amidophosphoribosyltransferase